MIGSLLSRMADAEKLSPQQLQQSEKDGMIPQGIGQLISQDNASMQSASKPIPQAPQGTVVDQIMQQATQSADPLVLIDHKINQLSKENLRLQEGIQTGEIKPYIGIPKLAEQVKELESLKSVKQQLEGKNQPVEDTQGIQSLQESAPQQTAQVNPQSPQQGIESVPTNLPTETMADSGIVAFANGGFNEVDDEAEDDELQKLFPSSSDNDDLLNELVSSGYNAPQEKPTEQPKANEGIKSVAPSKSNIKPLEQISNADQARKYNVGNLRPYDKFTYPGQIGVSKGGFAMFESPEAGVKALHQDINAKLGRGIDTPSKFISIYDPEPGNDVYIKNVSKALGIGPHDKIPNTPEARQLLAQAITRQEGAQFATARFAEGGIIALAQGGPTYTDKQLQDFDDAQARWEASQELQNNPYMQRVQAVRDIPSMLKSAGNYVANQYDLPSQVIGIGKKIKDWGQTPVGQQKAQFDAATENRKGRSFFDSNRSPVVDQGIPSIIPDAAKEQQQDIDASSNYVTSKTPSTASSAPSISSTQSNDKVSAPTIQNPTAPAATVPTLSGTDDFFNKYLNQLQQERDESKQGAETNKYLALLQAGLGMMGGTSPYAAANIGQGASQGIAAFSNLEKSRQENERNLGNQMLGLYKYKTSADVAKENQAANRELRMAGLNMTKEQRDATLKLEQDKLKDLNDQRAQSNLYNATKLVEADYNKDINNMGKSEAEKTAYIYNHPLVKDAAQKAGLDLSKYTSQPVIPSAAIEALKKDPSKKKEFEAKFKVSADQYLR